MKENYRMIPSEQAGYGPGRWVVQKHDPYGGVWFDIGDPLPLKAAQERLDVRRGRVSTD